MCSKLRLGFLSVLVFGMAIGCGSKGEKPPATISGAVRYGGQPLKGGEIFFHSEGKPPYHAYLGIDGTYEIPYIEPGPMTVTVDTEFVNPDKKIVDYSITKVGAGTASTIVAKQEKAAAAKGGSAEGLSTKQKTDQSAEIKAALKVPDRTPTTQRYVKIPSKYRDPKTSGLNYAVQPGRQSKDFDLTD
jgi:hypothetical protein